MPELESLGITSVGRQTDDEFLRGGMKHMLSLAARVLIPAASISVSSGDPEALFFGEAEDAVVDSFIDGLRANGYDIVKTQT